MIDIASIAETIALPAPPSGWVDYRYTALADGRLALIRTRNDFHAEHERWLEADKGDGKPRRYPDLWNDEMRLSIFDGTIETDITTVPSGTHPIVDRMQDGRWLVAASRADKGERNGRIYSAAGRKEQEMILGDGIEHVLCAADGTIWVGYFDKGVFAGQHRDGSWPVSSGGIVQFDPTGTVLWSFNEQAGDRPVDDAYAMTLSGNDLWACYYTGFPIARIRDGKPRFWSNSVAGAKAIAVKDDIVMLGGGYGDDANRIAIVKLVGRTAHEVGSVRYARTQRGGAELLQGRGSTLHIVSDGLWSKLSVYGASQAIIRDRGP